MRDHDIDSVMKQAEDILNTKRIKSKVSQLKNRIQPEVIGIGKYTMDRPDWIIVDEDGIFHNTTTDDGLGLLCIADKDYDSFIITDGVNIFVNSDFTKESIIAQLQQLYIVIARLVTSMVLNNSYPIITRNSKTKMTSIRFEDASKFKPSSDPGEYRDPYQACFETRELFIVLFASVYDVLGTLDSEGSIELNDDDLYSLKYLMSMMDILDSNNATFKNFMEDHLNED